MFMAALAACAGPTASEPPAPLDTDPTVVVETDDDVEIEGDVEISGDVVALKNELVARAALPEGKPGPRTDLALDPLGVDAVSWTRSTGP